MPVRAATILVCCLTLRLRSGAVMRWGGRWPGAVPAEVPVAGARGKELAEDNGSAQGPRTVGISGRGAG